MVCINVCKLHIVICIQILHTDIGFECTERAQQNSRARADFVTHEEVKVMASASEIPERDTENEYKRDKGEKEGEREKATEEGGEEGRDTTDSSS